jgi:hypothetical protein
MIHSKWTRTTILLGGATKSARWLGLVLTTAYRHFLEAQGNSMTEAMDYSTATRSGRPNDPTSEPYDAKSPMREFDACRSGRPIR